MCDIADKAKEQARIYKEIADDLETFADMMRGVNELDLYFSPQIIKDMLEDKEDE